MNHASVLLDVGGVIVDQRLRDQQWPRLVGAVFAALLGGDSQAWSEAHQVSTRQMNQAFANASASGDFLSFLRGYHLAWVQGMCTLVDLPAPPGAECLALASRAIAMVSSRVQAALPGAAEAVWTMHHQGYRLHTASGSYSREISGYLKGMGVQTCFGRPYGADLINTFKDGPNYYVRLCADLGIRPDEAVVVDDSAQAIAWAAQIGARTVLVGNAETASTADIGSLTELPAFLQRCHGNSPESGLAHDSV